MAFSCFGRTEPKPKQSRRNMAEPKPKFTINNSYFFPRYFRIYCVLQLFKIIFYSCSIVGISISVGKLWKHKIECFGAIFSHRKSSIFGHFCSFFPFLFRFGFSVIFYCFGRNTETHRNAYFGRNRNRNFGRTLIWMNECHSKCTSFLTFFSDFTQPPQ